MAFTNVKLYVVNGNRTNDRDVLINFANGQIAVLPKGGGEVMGSLPYGNIAKATYVKARNPKWDTALPSPPEGLDVGSFLPAVTALARDSDRHRLHHPQTRRQQRLARRRHLRITNGETRRSAADER